MKSTIAVLSSVLLAVVGVTALSAGPTQADEFADVETMVPARLLDTRSGSNSDTIDGRQLGGGPIPAGTETEVQVRGRAGVPNDATAAILNITAIQADQRGFITAYPCGSSRPLASTLNYNQGVNIANGSIIAIGDAGRVCVYNSDTTNLAIDITGYVPAAADLDTIVPARLLDTRSGSNSGTIDGRQLGGGPIPAGTETRVQVHGRADVPRDATAALLNITATQADQRGFITAYPCGSSRPLASTLNYNQGVNIANNSIIEIGDGAICVFNSDTTGLVVDVTGYTPDGTDLDTIVPERLLDTRSGSNSDTIDGLQLGGGTLDAGTETQVQVHGRPNIPNDATAAILNVTAIQADQRGFITAYPCGASRPLASTLNYSQGTNIANGAIIAIGDAGKVCIYNSDATGLAIDITGYIPPPSEGEGSTATTVSPTEAPLVPREFANAGVGRVCYIGDPNVQCDITPFNRVTDGPEYPDLTDPTAVAAGRSSSCVSVEDGQVLCFGNNDVGQLGNGSTRSSSTPVAVSGITNARDVDAGLSDFACSALRTGDVKCWGDNGSGQLGNGTTANSSVPVLVDGIDDAIAVSAGATSACALLADRTVSCWGSGLLGDGTNSDAADATPVLGLSNVTMVSVGGGHACAVIDDNSVACWGRNGSGQIGNGTREDAVITSVATGLDDVVAVAAGNLHSCARRSNGKIACWGENEAGQVGNNTSGDDVLTARTDPDVRNVVAISTGTGFSAVFSARPRNGANNLTQAMDTFGTPS